MKNDQKKSCFKKKIKKSLFKLGLLTILVSVVCGFIGKLFTRLRTNKFDKMNLNNPIRRYSCFLEDKLIIPGPGIIEGISIGSVLSNVTLDLRGCEFSDNAFITLKSNTSVIRVIVPSGINFKFDGLIKKSSVDNKASDDSLSRTVYIAATICMTAITIKPVD